MLARAGSTAPFLAPGAALGTLLLAFALVFRGYGLGPALWLAAATYVAFVIRVERGVDGTAPLVAVLLLLTGELTAWSLDERWRVRADEPLAWRRAAAVGVLALAGLTLATVVVALTAVSPNQGLAWTVAGAAAAVGAAGTGIWAARR